MPSLTTVQWRKNDRKRRLEKAARLESGEENITLEPTGEEGIELIKALSGLKQLISNVNIPNSAGQISNLPNDAVVETNAVFGRDRIQPIATGKLPEGLLKLTLPHIQNQDRCFKAALNDDRKLIAEAFEHDPLVIGHNCSKADVQKLVDDMLDATL